MSSTKLVGYIGILGVADPLLPVPGRSPSVGRYMVARRRVLPGELVFRDTPAVIGPDNSSVPLCTVCWG